MIMIRAMSMVAIGLFLVISVMTCVEGGTAPGPISGAHNGFTIKKSHVDGVKVLMEVGDVEGRSKVYYAPWASTEWVLREDSKYFLCRMMSRPIVHLDDTGNEVFRRVESKYELNYKDGDMEKRYTFISLFEMNQTINLLLNK
jgi:hypothetical protein